MLCASAPLRRRADAHIVFAAHLFVVRPSPASTFPLPPMSSEYSPLRRFSRWLTRWRHRCGYGVHSPWAFSWITEVIYNDFAYYAYAPLHRRRLLPAADPEALAGALNEKDDRLLFRLANAAEAREIALVGAVGPREKSLPRGCRTGARLTAYDALPSPVENCLAQHDFLYFSSADLLPTPPYSPISAESRPEGCRLAVVHGIDRGCRLASRLDCFPKPPRSARQLRSRAVRIGLFCPATPATALRCGLFLS